MPFSRYFRFSTAIVLFGFLAACSTPTKSDDTQAASTSFPMNFDNCGTTVELDEAPQRIVTIKSTTTEMLLALGAEDQIIARAFPDGPIPEDLDEAAAGIQLISDRLPGQESVLDLEPDFIYAGWESNLTADGLGERDTLASMGIGSYVSASACKGEHQPNPLTFDLVFEEIKEVGRWAGRSEEAAELVAEQRAELESLEPLEQPLRALWFSSGSDVPFVGAGIGAPQMIMDAAGLENIASEVEDSWGPFSWEAVIDADPEVIVLVDSAWGSTQKKIDQIESMPAMKNVTAVKERRYLVVPFAAGEAGVRNVEAVRTLLEQVKK